MALWGIIERGIGVNLSQPTEMVQLLRFLSTIRADVARREDLVGAVRAFLAHKCITLLFYSPMAGNFHRLYKPLLIPDVVTPNHDKVYENGTLKNYQLAVNRSQPVAAGV